MKLHLPSFLRKALLACLASLAAHSLPVTVSTGSLVASGALISFLSAQQSLAADEEDDDEDEEESLLASDALTLDQLAAIAAVDGSSNLATYTGESGIAPIAASGVQFTGPDVEWSTADEDLGTSAVAGIDDLDNVEGDAIASTIWGQETKIAGGRGKSLKLVRNSAAGNGTKLRKNNAGKGLEVTNLWLTSMRTGSNNWYSIDQEDYLTSYIQDIWINAVGVSIGYENSTKINVSDLVANFHLGDSATSSLTDHAALEVNNASVTTSGYLDVVQNAVLVLRSNVSSLTVSELRGDGDLTLSTASAATAGASLTLRNGGASYGGALTFAGTQAMNVILGSADAQEPVTLQTTGLKGTSGASFTRADGSTQNVTLKITGNDDTNSASNISIDAGILLQLEDGAKQSFASSTISGGLSLGNNSTLSLSGATTVSGALTLSGDATINIDWVEGLSLNFSTISAGSYHVNLIIANIDSFTKGNYQLFDNWNEAWADIFVFQSFTVGHRSVHFINGAIVVAAEELVWDGTGFTWADETELMEADGGGGVGWKLSGSANYFTNGDAVEFNNEVGGTVTLGSNITTDNMTIADGTWVFAAEEHTLSVNGTLDVGENTITLGGGTFNISALAGSGKVVYNGSSLSIGDASLFAGVLQLDATYALTSDLSFGTGGSVYVNGAGKLSVSSGSTLKADVKLNTDDYSAYALTLSDNGKINGNVIICRNTSINAGTNATITGDIVADGGNGFILDFFLGDTTSALVINGTLKDVSTLRLQKGALTINGGLTAENLGSTTFTVTGRGTGNDGHLTVNGAVSGITTFNVNTTVGSVTYLNLTGAVALAGNTTFNVTSTGSGGASYIQLSGTVTGDATAKMIKTGNRELKITGNMSGYFGSLELQEGNAVLNSTTTGNMSVVWYGGELSLANIAGSLSSITTGTSAVTGTIEGNTWTITSLVVGSGGVTFNGAGALTLNGLSGSGLLTKAGTGALNLAGDATNGSVALSAGITMNLTAVAGAYTLGSFSTSGTTGTMVLNQNSTNQKWTINQLTVAEGTTLTLAGSAATSQGANRYISINGMIGGTGTITLNGGTLRVSGESGFGGSMSVITSGCLVLEEGSTWGSALTLSRYSASGNSAYQGALVMFNGSSITGLVTLSGDTRIESGADSDQYKMTLIGGIDAGGNILEVVWGKFDISGAVSNLGEINLTNTTLTIKSDLTAASVTNGTLSIGKAHGAYEGELYLSGSVSGITHFVNNNTAANGTGSMHEMFFTGSLELEDGADFTGNSGGNFNISGALTGSGTFVKAGTSTLTISGDISHTGSLTVNAGAVVLNSDAASMAGVTLDGGTLTLGGAGGTLQSLTLNTASTVTLNSNWKIGSQLTVDAEKALILGGGGSLELTHGAAVSSSITLNNGSSLILSGGDLDLSGGSLLGSGTLVIGPSGGSIQLGSIARAIGDIFGASIALDLSQAWGSSNQVQLFSFDGWAWDGDTWNTFAQAVYGMVRAGTTISPRATLELNQDGLLTLGEGGAIVWNGGDNNTWTVSATAEGEGWLTEAGQENTAFIANDLVIFNSEASVTLGGTITAGSMTVDIAGTGTELGTLTLSAGGGSLTVSRGVTVTQGALVVDGTGSGVYTLGDVSLAEGTEFRIDFGSANPFVANGTMVHGDGALVITAADGNIAFFTSLLASATDGATLNATKLHELRLSASGNAFEIINPNKNALARVEHLVLKDVTLTVNGDNCLIYGANRLMDSAGNIIANVLHLSGNSSANTRANLHTTNGATIQWDVMLDDDASIAANKSVTLTISGALYVSEGKTLTIGTEADNGWGTVEFQNVAQAGDIIVRGADDQYNNLVFNFSALANREAFSMKAAKTLDLSTAQSKLKLTGNGAGITYVIENLKGSGSVSRNGTTGTAILQISNELAAADGAFSGTIDSNITVNLTGGYWAMNGATVKGAVSVANGGNLNLVGAMIIGDNGSLDLSAGNVSFNGLTGLSLSTVGHTSLTGTALFKMSATQLSAFSTALSEGGFTLSLVGVQSDTKLGADWQLNLFDFTGLSGDNLATLKETLLRQFNTLLSGYLFDGDSLEWKAEGVLGLGPVDLWWNGQAEVWDATNDIWLRSDLSTQSAFVSDARLHFEGDGAPESKVVTLADNSAYVANSVFVDGGTWNFASDTSTTSLTISNALSVVSGSAEFTNLTMTLQGDVSTGTEATLLFGENVSLALNGAALLGTVYMGWSEGADGLSEQGVRTNVTLAGEVHIGEAGLDSEDGQVTQVYFGGIGDITLSPQGGSLSIEGQTTVTISSSGSKLLGNVTLGAGSVLAISDASNWSGTSITGDGTLRLLLQSSTSSGITVNLAALANALLSDTQGALARMDLGVESGNVAFTLGSNVNTKLLSVQDIYLAKNNTINLSNASFDGVKLHLGGGYAVGSAATLVVTSNTSVNIILEEGADASWANSSGINWTGSLTANKGTFTKVGDARLNLNSGFTTSGTGKLALSVGEIVIGFTHTDGVFKGWDIDVASGATLYMGGVDSRLTINSLSGGGSIQGNSSSLNGSTNPYTLVIDFDGTFINGSTGDATFSGSFDSPSGVKAARVSLVKMGAGKQIISRSQDLLSLDVQNGTLELVAGGSASGNSADGAALALGEAGTLALGGDFTVSSLADAVSGATITRSTSEGASTKDVYLVLGMDRLAANTKLANITFETVSAEGAYKGKRVALKNSAALELTGTATIGTDWTLGANLTLGNSANITLDGALTFGTTEEGASHTLTLTSAEMTVSDIIYTEDISILGSGTFTLNLAQDKDRVAGKGLTVGAMTDGTASGPKFVLKGAHTLELGGSNANINFYGDVEVVKDTAGNNATLKVFGTPNAAIYGALSGNGTLAMEYATLALYQTGSIGSLTVAQNEYLKFGTTGMTFTAAALSGDGTLYLDLLDGVTSGTLALTNDASLSGLSITGATVELASGKMLTLSSLTMAKGSAAINTTTGGTATVKLTGALSLDGNHELTLGDGVSLTGTSVLLDGVHIDKNNSATYVTHEVGGTLTLTGDLTINGQGSTAGSNKLYLSKGGSVAGAMKVGWGASLYLGGDLEVGSIVSGTDQIGSNSSINKDGTGDVFLFNKDLTGVSSVSAFNAKYDITGLTIDSNIGYGVVSSLTLSEGGTFNRAFKVKGADSTLTLNGASQTYTFSKAVSGDGAIALADGAGLALSAGGSISSLTVSGASSISLGSKFSVGTLNLGATGNVVTLAVSGLTAHTDTSNGWLLDIAALAGGSAGSLQIDLSGVHDLTAGTYDFFGESWSLVKNNLQGIISIETGKGWLEATVDANGCITITKGATAELTWNVDANSDEWNTSDLTWLENGIAFAQGDSVTFRHATGETVTVADGVEADGMTVAEGTGWEFAMQGSMEVTTLTIETGAKATFSDGGTLALGTLSGAGTFGVAAGTTVDLSSTTTTDFSGSLEVGGTLRVGSINISGLSGTGTLILGSSAANAGAVTLGISTASTFSGSVTLAQDTTISAGGNSITFGRAAEGTTAASTFDFGKKLLYLQDVSNGTINGNVANLAAIKFIGQNSGNSVLHITGDVTGADSSGIENGADGKLLVHQHNGALTTDHKLYLDGAVSGISTYDVVTASLYFCGTLTASNAITFSGGGAKYIQGTLTGEEAITLSGGTLTLGGEASSDLSDYTGTLAVSGGTLNVLSAYSSTLSITGGTTNVQAAVGGTITMSGGTLNVEAAVNDVTVTADNTVTVAATGSVKALTVKGGTNLTLAGTAASLEITSSSGWANSATINTKVHITSATAEVSGAFKTSHMMGIEFASGAQLTVGGTLTIGSSSANIGGNFRLAMAENAETPATLVLSEGGTIGERLVLEDGITVKIGSGKTLTVGWLQEYADDHTAGGTITTTTTDGTATLMINSTGKSDSASGLTFGSGITLELIAGATQTLSSSTINGDVQLDGTGAVLTIIGADNSFAGTLKGEGGTMKVTGTLAFSGKVDTTGGAGLALAEGTLNLSHTDTTAHNLGTVAITTGGTINVQSGEWTLGGLSGDSLTTLNVATGATLEVGAGSMQVSALTLAGTLAVTELSATDALFTGISTFSADAFTLDLSGWAMSAGEYQLFAGTAGDWSVGTLTIKGYKEKNWNVTYADGVLTVEQLWGVYEWEGVADNIVWGGEDADTWDGMDWERGADVTFKGSAATQGGVVQVGVQADIEAGDMLVESGSYSFSSSGDGTSHTLTADSLTVEQGADAEFGLDVTTGSLSGTGDVTMNGATLKVGTDGMADFEGSLDLKNGGTLATGGDMSLSSGASLTSSAGTGNVELGGNLTFEDFSEGMLGGSLHFTKAADTTAESVNVDLHVGAGATSKVKTPSWSFGEGVTLRKTGAGKLTLDGGLGGYTGFIYVDDGRLELLSDSQSLAGGFGFNLNNLTAGNVGDAYLQGGTLTLPNGGTTTKLQLDVDGTLGLGVYYLASGLQSGDMEDASSLFDTVLPTVGANQELLLFIEDGTLVLRVMQAVGKDEFVWDGGLGAGGSEAGNDDNWRGGANADHKDLDAIFDASARNQDVVFHSEGDGSFRSAHVRSGEYTFDNAKDGDGFTLTNGLYVGGYVEDGNDAATAAKAELKGENAGLSHIEVRENGTLVISHSGAVSSEAKIYLDKQGVIAYGDDASGKLLFSGDLSGQIEREETVDHVQSGVVQVQVGRSSAELPGAQTYAARDIATIAAANETVPAGTVVWGSTSGNTLTSGVKGILEDGIVKLGHGALEVQWSAAQLGDFVPTLTRVEVQDGTLTLRVGSATQTTLANGDGTTLDVEEGATLQLLADGSQSRFTVNRSITGAGRVVIGSQTDAGNYTLGGSNGAFTGTLELLGDGKSDYVTLTAAGDVLGGAGATLKLNGREIGLDGAAVTASAVTLSAGTVEVAAGSVNRLGGVSQNGAKPEAVNGAKNITLSGALTGAGTLVAAAEAQHTLSGELSGFTGTLSTEADASWTLSGTVDGQKLAANYSGEGSIISAIGGDVTLTGGFSENVGLDVQSGKVLLTGAKNTATGELNVANGATVQVGDAKTAATWGLNNEAVRLGAGTGTLLLENGTVGNIVSNGGASVQVKAAGTTVQVSGTNGKMFDKITISDNGKLSGVSGTILTKDTDVKLTLTSKNVGTAPDAKGALIEMQPDGVLMLEGAGDKALQLEVDNKVFTDILANKEGEGEFFLHLLNEAGELKLSARMSDWMDAVKAGENLTLLLDLDFNLRRAEDAKNEMVLAGTSGNVYLVLGPDDAPDAKSRPHTVSDYGILSDKYYATVVDSQATLTLEVGDLPADGLIDAEEDEDRQAALRRDKAAGGLLVRNLVGQAGATLHAENHSATGNDVTVVFDNSRIADLVELDTTGVDSSLNADVRGQDTHFLGTIVGDEGVNFDKQGKGTLYVGNETDGGVQIAGDVKVSEGALAVTSGEKGSSMGSLTFNYTTAAAAGEKRGFAVSGGSLELGAINENNEGAGRAGHTGDNVIRVVEEGNLTLNFADDALLLTTHLEGDGSGSLTVDGSNGGSVTLNSDGMSSGEQTRIADMDLHVSNKGKLTLTQGSKISNGDVWVENGALNLQTDAALNTSGSLKLDKNGSLTLDETASVDVRGGAQVDGKLTVGGGRVALTQLSGSGTIAGGTGSSLTLRGEENSFSGALAGEGSIYVTKGAALTLDNVTRGTDSTDGRWNVENRGSLTVDLSKVDPKHKTELGNVTLGSGSHTELVIDTDAANYGERMTMSQLGWETGASLLVTTTGSRGFLGDGIDLGALSGALQEDASSLNITLDGMAFLHYEADKLYKNAEGHLILGMEKLRENLFSKYNMTGNALAGADMFWNASDPNSANWQKLTNNFFDALRSDLYWMVSGLNELQQDGKDGELANALAAGAGASTSVLGSALSQDIRRQLNAIRNRTTMMAGDQQYDTYDAAPYYHVWINGEGSYHKMDADGLNPGFSLNSWGGTVGAELELSDSTTVGLALSAMYGDLKTDSADNGRGDIDTTYLTAFARMAQGAWVHTFVVTGGLADVKLNRTVSCGSFSYNTHGSTDGYALGALYEVGYATAMNADRTFVLQTVFNVEYRHTAINGYTESGSDAGLTVGDISHDALTFGAGARMQALVGERVFNRAAVLEGRVLVKADAGDRKGVADNALTNGDGTVRRLNSAEVGVMGVEIGAGINIPLGSEYGSIFFDASVELRSGYTSMDANVGYRVSF